MAGQVNMAGITQKHDLHKTEVKTCATSACWIFKAFPFFWLKSKFDSRRPSENQTGCIFKTQVTVHVEIHLQTNSVNHPHLCVAWWWLDGCRRFQRQQAAVGTSSLSGVPVFSMPAPNSQQLGTAPCHRSCDLHNAAQQTQINYNHNSRHQSCDLHNTAQHTPINCNHNSRHQSCDLHNTAQHTQINYNHNFGHRSCDLHCTAQHSQILITGWPPQKC